MCTHLPLVRAPVATPGKRSPWLGVHVPATTPSWKMTDVGEQPLSLPHPSPTSHRDSHAGLFPFRLPQLSTRRAAGLSFIPNWQVREKKCKVSLNSGFLGRVEEKQRKKRFSYIPGIIERIYFLVNSYKELTLGLVGIGL